MESKGICASDALTPLNRYADKPREECGVFGIYACDDDMINPAKEAYHALFALQHRGQESCGIAVNRDGVIRCHKAAGLVPDVFSEEILNDLRGSMAVGHCRYSTTGSLNQENAQPIVIGHIKGNLAVAHNGNLTNALTLRRDIELGGGIFRGTNDSEVIAYMIVRERLKTAAIEEAVKSTMNYLEGAYSLVIMSPRKMIAARDPHGFRPLCIGKLGEAFVFASESCALDALGATFIRDVLPGEIVVCEKGSIRSIFSDKKVKSSLCVFEFIYFARPDSVIDGASVEKARQEAGRYLALENPTPADLVIGVPDSGISAALGYSAESGIPYGVGFIKNRYIGRTFIQPVQNQRERAVRIKLNALAQSVKGKRIIMVDDSIVRGTTSAHIVNMLRDAGATEVHMRISSPPFLYPCFFGTDVPDKKQLFAHNYSLEQSREQIGVDSLAYLSLEATRKIAVGARIGLCDACFSGKYPVKVPEKTEKTIFERGLSEC